MFKSNNLSKTWYRVPNWTFYSQTNKKSAKKCGEKPCSMGLYAPTRPARWVESTYAEEVFVDVKKLLLTLKA